VFYVGGDPVVLGLVASLNRPAGNLTGVTGLNNEVGPKRLELLHELVPNATSVALLVNPTTPAQTDPQSRDTQAAARKLGLQLHVLHASNEREAEWALRARRQQKAHHVADANAATKNRAGGHRERLSGRRVGPAGRQCLA
jgi:putative ABC transport system substrate-binding protein